MPYVLNIGSSQAPADAVRLSLDEILSDRALLALATADPTTGAHANTAFFAHDDDLVVYFVSERSTRHSVNLGTDPRAMATVFVDPPVYGESLRGVQLEGRVAEAAVPDGTARALSAYQARFPSFAADPDVRDRFLRAEGPSVFYRFEIDQVTVLDEPRFGRRVYVRAEVSR